MKHVMSLADHLAPDTISQLERAAELRHDDGLVLLDQSRGLGAVYLFGHSAEMCLAAAYFRAAGFPSKRVINRDTRLHHMNAARNLHGTDGKPLMTGDPHPLVGWARFLQRKRSASKLLAAQVSKLEEALRKAELLYKHWRPELRYKTTTVSAEQMEEVVKSSAWFLEQRGRL
jgi:hypothetical protein